MQTPDETWAKNPNKMVIFPPNTHPNMTEEYQKDRWLLADKHTILATGFSEDDMKNARNTIKRKR